MKRLLTLGIVAGLVWAEHGWRIRLKAHQGAHQLRQLAREARQAHRDMNTVYEQVRHLR